MELIFGLLAFAISVPTLYINFLNSSPDTQLRFKQATTGLFRLLARVAGYLVIILFFAGSLTEIIRFWTSVEPISRPEVVLLIMHMAIFCIYGVLGTLTIKTDLKTLIRRKNRNLDGTVEPQ